MYLTKKYEYEIVTAKDNLCLLIAVLKIQSTFIAVVRQKRNNQNLFFAFFFKNS